jgi:hypothetical protein
MHYCFFVVVAVQSEKSGSSGVEPIVEEFEILDS